MLSLMLLALLPAQQARAQAGQCLGSGCAFGGSQYPTATQTSTSQSFSTVATNIYAGEWARYTVTNGQTYEWSLCSADGGSVSYDAQLTLYNDNSTPSQLCYSDDLCDGNRPKIRYTATYTGNVRVLVNQYNCTTNSTNTTVRWRCESCAPPGCTNTSQYPTSSFVAPAAGTTYSIVTNQWQSEYNQMTGATAGHTFVSTASIGGTWITVRSGAYNGALVAQGATPLSWTASAGGTYFIHYNTNSSCGTASTGMTTTVQNTTPPAACLNSTMYPTSSFAAPAPGSSAYQISTCQYQSEYNHMTGAPAGNTFTSTASFAGTYITVRAGTYNGTVVAAGTTPLNWTATTGGAYFIHYNTNSSCGTASSCMTTTVQNTTSNDLCANAFTVASLPHTSALVSNASATDDTPSTTCSGPYKNLWWKVTGICGTMTASTCGGGTSFDTEMAVFTGSCGSFTQVGCIDDNGPACTGLQASVSWTSQAGTIYYISVGSYGTTSATGNVQLNVTGADVTPPGITCPGTQAACSASMPDYTGLATTSDNCTATGSISVTQSPIPGSALGLGNTTVTLTATDAASNQAQCTFTVSQPDSDGDNTADCADGCPSDPNKTAPGQCGCGNPDTDTDTDGTADCNDGCPNDPAKIGPGICGCGVADTDSDTDGTADCNDGCPNDPAKTAPGICGCGVADTDSDTDGTADCNDGCPNDPAKTAPGICGCGVADTDTDTDGTADCNDGCPNDPGKTAPGICGCGVADTDSDTDGTADCNDGCPNDPAKTAPGICGCGVADTDSDTDGTADCNDGCPNDPAKTAPGQCGCGNPDTDTDSDGTADCNDDDDDNDGVTDTAEAVCGSDPLNAGSTCEVCDGVDNDLDTSVDEGFIDTDDDGSADCVDLCPADPDKTSPGTCGCFTPDDDTDGDGLADCVDPCPESADNLDSDGDGTHDCYDACPLDPNKVYPGACGCGVPDTDNDGDTYADCVDGCPGDPMKIGPGACGCGIPETDTDGDASPDCLDTCPYLSGQIGDPCDDGDPATSDDSITGSCGCAGTDPDLCILNEVSLELATDGHAAETTWEIVLTGSSETVCSGGGYADNTAITVTCCLANGCYGLVVYDSAGDGISPGGFTLRDADGRRIIDNAGNGALFAYDSSAPFGFCVPIGGNALMAGSCDVQDATPNTVLRAVIDPAVTAQYGVSNANSGYQFWFFNPHGGYNRRIALTHASPGSGYPGGSPVAERCSYLRLSQMQTYPIPLDVPLNVRVRAQINGVYNEFGPACRLLLPTPGCPNVQLTTTATPVISCGATGLSHSSAVWADNVTSATNYQFEFSRPGYTRRIASSTRSQQLNFVTYPLLNNTCYNVRVRVSFDGGTTYCPFGPTCTITMGTAICDFGAMAPVDDGAAVGTFSAEARMRLWPNPTNGQEVSITLRGFATPDEGPAHVLLLDGTGRQVHQAMVALESGHGTAVLALPTDLAPGPYLVQVQAGGQRIIERLILQR